MCKSLGQWFYGKENLKRSLIVFSECDPGDEMKPHVIWIRTNDPAFKTKEGLGVGSTIEEIQLVFPNLEILGTYGDMLSKKTIVLLNAQKAGITFEVEKEAMEICHAIMVNEPGKSPHIAYFDFYPGLELEE